jgi:hypothetical protein
MLQVSRNVRGNDHINNLNEASENEYLGMPFGPA